MTTKCSIGVPESHKKSLAHRPWAGQLLAIGVFFALVCCTRAAGTYYWDASAGTGPSDGNGNWYGTSNWWNVPGGTNYTWSGTGDEEFVIFGAGSGTAGTYFVTNNASVTQPLNVVFTNAGSYTIVTDGTDAGELQTIVSGGGTSALTNGFYVATNVTAVIDVPWRQVGSSDMVLGSNSVLTFGQGTFGTLGQMTFKGSGPALSTINATNGTWGGVNNPSGTTTADGVTFNVTGAAIVNFGTRFDIGRTANPGAGYPVANGVVNVGGPGASAQLNVNTSAGNNTGNHLQVSRGGPAVLNIMPGGSVSTLSYISGGTVISGNLRITPDSSSQGMVNMSGGTLNLGIGAGGTAGLTSANLTSITLFDATSPSATASAIFNLSGGLVGAKSIMIGNGATWSANPTNQVNISGGTLYLDAPNIKRLNGTGTNSAINLSGGTIGATASWQPACSVPLNLTNINGNITFQAADAGGNPFNISLSGALSGVGGLNKTGGGTLTLSGTNAYGGTTTVSNGTLAVSTLYSPANGPVVVDGSAGTPELSVQVNNVGQNWAVSGLSFNAGSPALDFNYGSFAPSTTVAPLQVGGNVAFGATPQITVEGSAIPVGTFPLVTYAGTLSGAVPSVVTLTLSGGSATASLVNNTSAKTISLVVSASTYNPALTWRAGDGFWDFASLNWLQGGSPTAYADGDAVLLDDTASGTSPITVTLNTAVNPSSVTVNDSAKSYVITGSGGIGGSTSLTKDGTGTLTLTATNTYTGGTVLNAGQLNINYGGNGAASSAIGSGPLTIKLGAVIDNTSGQSVALLTPIAENWNDDFTFVGSTNLNTGLGNVTLGSGTVSLTVSSNTLEVDGLISDNGSGYGIAKTGNGTLVLSNANNFSGGLTLSAGTLDLNQGGAAGTGALALSGGTLDNTSGGEVALTVGSVQWKNSFTFNGSSSLDLGSAPISIGSLTMTINSNTLYTEGALEGANTSLTMNGPGTWTIGGSTLNNGGFGLTINSGLVNFDRGFLYPSVNSSVTVNTNATVYMLNPVGTQMALASSFTLNGGLVELNGDNGEIFQSITFDSGTLQNSSGSAEFNLTGPLSLVGTNCDFNLTNNSSLEVDAIVSNTGSLYETGNGTLTLSSNNLYTGDTVIAGGTLALTGIGSISNSVVIDVSNGATLDVTLRGDQTLTLNNGQSLTGNGSINGGLVAASGSTVAPGGTVTTGTLTVTNNVTLNGTLQLNLNSTNTPTSSQLVSASGTITYGGTLSVTNTGPALTAGATFQLFPAAITTFAGYNLATTDASGNVYTWNNKVAVNGSIQVATVTPPSTINPSPGTLLVSLTGDTLNLAWPTNAGWLLQAQTNSLATGLSTTWITVLGSGTETNTSITIDPNNGAVFYRMVHP